MVLPGRNPVSAPAGRTVHRSPFTVHEAKPWFREPWPWLLIAGPAAVIVAGAITIWLAVSSDDGLVADDYYRRGLAINKVLGRDRLAATLGLRATVSQDGQGALQVSLAGGNALPPALTLRLVHPTRGGDDRVLPLPRVETGVYRAERVPLPAGRRRVILEDEAGTWRLTGEWRLPSVQPLELAPRSQ
ncbi:MAG: FixH family protein [Betaproteobacteria bacterium]|nr:FixH family protein [Betaproteobacteria bacterium]